MSNKKKFIIPLIITGLLIIAAYVFGIGCPIKYMTGISCPGCGMSRALYSCLKLDFSAAFHYHPLFFMVPVILVLVFFSDKLKPKIKNIIVLIIAVLFIGVYIIRLIGGENDVIQIDVGKSLAARIIGLIH